MIALRQPSATLESVFTYATKQTSKFSHDRQYIGYALQAGEIDFSGAQTLFQISGCERSGCRRIAVDCSEDAGATGGG